jgi:D-alanine-D-alanine ligase
MKIGIAFSLKEAAPPAPGLPDDWQEEFDSPETVAAIAAAIRAHGHQVVELGDGRPFVEKLLADPPDLVFNIAEGRGVSRSREARVPAVCEMLGVPCTGSDPGTLAAALDKDWARSLLIPTGIWQPWQRVYYGPEVWVYPLLDTDQYRCPLIAKPAWEGSSKGVRRHCIIEKIDDAQHVLKALWCDYRQPIVIEEFIIGDEVTVGLVGATYDPRVLGVMRIVPRQPNDRFIYGLEVKRDWQRRVDYECPAPLPADALKEIERCAVRAYHGLGCRDVARIDFRVREGRPYFIEANPLPGLNPETGDLSLLARFMGVDHTALIGMILDAALARR